MGAVGAAAPPGPAAAPRFLAARQRGGFARARGRPVREGVRPRAGERHRVRAVRRGGAQRDTDPHRARAHGCAGPTATPLVPPCSLRAGVLHGLRRQNASRRARGDRAAQLEGSGRADRDRGGRAQRGGGRARPRRGAAGTARPLTKGAERPLLLLVPGQFALTRGVKVLRRRGAHAGDARGWCRIRPLEVRVPTVLDGRDAKQVPVRVVANELERCRAGRQVRDGIRAVVTVIDPHLIALRGRRVVGPREVDRVVVNGDRRKIGRGGRRCGAVAIRCRRLAQRIECDHVITDVVLAYYFYRVVPERQLVHAGATRLDPAETVVGRALHTESFLICKISPGHGDAITAGRH